ncbi:MULTISPECIES: PH domain-containing protein [unclassified Acinetobacter]|uniref:PH domain-containing protein n=1 Tax=unclassified Acinetobacter TaxID=196816 RepID=UPI0015D2CBBC|nr:MULTISPECIES: PH domain-containing protein [unclassified Acinetobacter]UUS60583.1 PH domain-containing protein [Acinetobacter sp. YH16056_T]
MQVFRSKKDWWVVAFIICMSGLLIQLLLTMQAKGTMQQYPVHTAVYVLTVLILWWPFNTRYQITKTHLNIRSMFVRWRIPLVEIQRVSPSQDLSAAPALSIKRLKIEYVQEGKAKFVMVSPKDQQAFAQALGINLS